MHEGKTFVACRAGGAGQELCETDKLHKHTPTHAHERIYYFLIFFAKKESFENRTMKRVTDMTHNQQQQLQQQQLQQQQQRQQQLQKQKQQPQLRGNQLAAYVCICKFVCMCVCGCALADAKEIWRQFYAQAARTKKVSSVGQMVVGVGRGELVQHGKQKSGKNSKSYKNSCSIRASSYPASHTHDGSSTPTLTPAQRDRDQTKLWPVQKLRMATAANAAFGRRAQTGLKPMPR